MEKRIAGVDVRIFAILLVASVVGLLLVIPYALTLQKPALEATHLPIPLPALIALQVLINAIFYALFVFIGLLCAGHVGLGTPLLESWLDGKQYDVRRMLLRAIPLGIVAALLIIILDSYVFITNMPAPSAGFTRPPAWQGFLASFEGGISEEVMLRLFLLSLIVLMLSLIRKGAWAYWTAIVLTSLVFGALHLPTAGVVWELTATVVVRTLVLNGLAGLAFGWLYWQYGLESAMVAHFTADIVMHFILPLAFG